MTDIYGRGRHVTYTGNNRCDRLVHAGHVIKGPFQVGQRTWVIVQFTCCDMTYGIPTDLLQPAG